MVHFLIFFERRKKTLQTEAQYQSKLKKRLKEQFPDAFIFKMDPTAIDFQGFPDLIILKGNKWAALEVKRSRESAHQPNQDAIIQKIQQMGNYSAFIFPENEKEITNELARVFES